MIQTFEYKGYWCSDAESFFAGNYVSEERAGCATVGFFVKLANNETVMPAKGDKFIKSEDGKIKQLL